MKPCILHGDLWSGNIGSVDGHPSIFDPASYYGHSEAEFGISWCAGFGQVGDPPHETAAAAALQRDQASPQRPLPPSLQPPVAAYSPRGAC